MTKLEEVRKTRGVSKKAAANLLGVSTVTYSKYENDPDLMTIAQATQISNFLCCPVDDLFFGPGGKDS